MPRRGSAKAPREASARVKKARGRSFGTRTDKEYSEELFERAKKQHLQGNYRIAAMLYKDAMASDRDNDKAMNNLGTLYFSGQHPDGKNYDTAELWFRTSAGLGNQDAAFNLKKLLGIRIETWEKDTNNPVSLVKLAHYCLRGAYPTQQHEDRVSKAVEFLEKAIRLGAYEEFMTIANLYADRSFTDHLKYAEIHSIVPPDKKTHAPSPRKILDKLFLSQDCPMCMGPLVPNVYGVRILICGHGYHDECYEKFGGSRTKKCIYRC
jgi:tetratricopeptide (TPR) repeat protein